MGHSVADWRKKNALPTADFKPANQGCLDMKQAYTNLFFREIVARNTEQIVRRAWESYARRGGMIS
jgi:hypothetical protein